MNISESVEHRELVAATVELCERGFLTCTRGRPGDDDATYALAWLPLDNPESLSFEVRRTHAENMRRQLGNKPTRLRSKPR